MNISGIVIHARPQELSVLAGKLRDMPGVDVHTATEDGRIIITVEDTPENAPAETLMSVQNLPGVLNASMVYNYCDE
ncbi:MAG: chaperone NapD [Desulfobulbaceae bacterium]|nr:chaperone NapD [Desulfobulbaceae bacterium]